MRSGQDNKDKIITNFFAWTSEEESSQLKMNTSQSLLGFTKEAKEYFIKAICGWGLGAVLSLFPLFLFDFLSHLRGTFHLWDIFNNADLLLVCSLLTITPWWEAQCCKNKNNGHYVITSIGCGLVFLTTLCYAVAKMATMSKVDEFNSIGWHLGLIFCIVDCIYMISSIYFVCKYTSEKA